MPDRPPESNSKAFAVIIDMSVTSGAVITTLKRKQSDTKFLNNLLKVT